MRLFMFVSNVIRLQWFNVRNSIYLIIINKKCLKMYSCNADSCDCTNACSARTNRSYFRFNNSIANIINSFYTVFFFYIFLLYSTMNSFSICDVRFECSRRALYMCRLTNYWWLRMHRFCQCTLIDALIVFCGPECWNSLIAELYSSNSSNSCLWG